MSEVPDPLARLDVLRGALTLTHETAYDLHLELVDADRATSISRALLAESAEIALHKTSEATADVRLLAARWHEQSVLDPHAAQETALQLEKELDHAESLLRELLARDIAIVAELRALANDDG